MWNEWNDTDLTYKWAELEVQFSRSLIKIINKEKGRAEPWWSAQITGIEEMVALSINRDMNNEK